MFITELLTVLLLVLNFKKLIFHFCLFVSLSGSETKLVQPAVLPLLTAVMADSSEDSEWPLRDRGPLLLRLSQKAVLL